MVQTDGNATPIGELSPAIATETATAVDVPGGVTENQDLNSDASGEQVRLRRLITKTIVQSQGLQ